MTRQYSLLVDNLDDNSNNFTYFTNRYQNFPTFNPKSDYDIASLLLEITNGKNISLDPKENFDMMMNMEKTILHGTYNEVIGISKDLIKTVLLGFEDRDSHKLKKMISKGLFNDFPLRIGNLYVNEDKEYKILKPTNLIRRMFKGYKHGNLEWQLLEKDSFIMNKEIACFNDGKTKFQIRDHKNGIYQVEYLENGFKIK